MKDIVWLEEKDDELKKKKIDTILILASVTECNSQIDVKWTLRIAV